MVPRKAGLPALPGPGAGGVPDFSNILQSQELTLVDKRRKVLEGLGLRKPRKKYKTKEERKATAKERAKARRAERLQLLEKYGLGARPKGKKKYGSKEERKAAGKERAKDKRRFLREMARKNPDLARKYGIDPERFRE